MGKKSALTSDELALLGKFDTPTICNVIELFDVRPRNRGYMDGRIRADFPEFPPMVGYSCTATFRSASPPRAGQAYQGFEAQMEAMKEIPEPHVVVFQDLDNPPAAATFGEVMCSSYQRFGCVGLITSGAGRDLEQVKALGFPVFTSQSICAHGYCHFLDVNIPVHVGGMTIYPGDLLHGDGNGVTTIPETITAAVAHACEEFIAAEGVVLDCLQSKDADLQALEDARQQCMRRIEELGKKVRQKTKV